MRAARLVETGRPLEVREVELPAPGPDEVLVDLEFGGVNPVDGYMAEGRVGADGPLPRTLGGEGAGRIGDRRVAVFGAGLGAVRDGLWAQAAVVPKSAVFEVPDAVEPEQAAALGVAGVTACNVVRLAEVGADDRVLVLGASGGVGLAIVSLAASSGAAVWGQTTNPDKGTAVVEQGAQQVVVSDASGLSGSVGEFRPTVVLDPLGAGFTQAALSCMEPHGRLVLFGTSAGHEGVVQLQQLYRNGLRILGYAGLRLTDDQRRSGLEEASRAVAEGRLKLRVDRTLPLEEVNLAFDLLSRREVTGKILLDLA